MKQSKIALVEHPTKKPWSLAETASDVAPGGEVGKFKHNNSNSNI